MLFWFVDSNMCFVLAMTASQMRIAETIDAFYGDTGAKDGVSRSYKQAVEDLDAETIKALDGPYRYAIYNISPPT
jgi:bridging integrator 3